MKEGRNRDGDDDRAECLPQLRREAGDAAHARRDGLPAIGDRKHRDRRAERVDRRATPSSSQGPSMLRSASGSSRAPGPRTASRSARDCAEHRPPAAPRRIGKRERTGAKRMQADPATPAARRRRGRSSAGRTRRARRSRRRAGCSDRSPAARVSALSNSATKENEMTKPSAIAAGRSRLGWPTEAPSRIGSTGRVQGAAIVATPASRARTSVQHVG